MKRLEEMELSAEEEFARKEKDDAGEKKVIPHPNKNGATIVEIVDKKKRVFRRDCKVPEYRRKQGD